MSEVAEYTPSSENYRHPQVVTLGRDIVLISWDVSPSEFVSAPKLTSSAGPIAPLASLRLVRSDGGLRLLWALSRRSDETLDVKLSTAPVGLRAYVSIAPGAAVSNLDSEALLDELDGSARVALISALLNVWVVMFRLQRNRTFIRTLREILAYITPQPGPVDAAAQVGTDLVLLRTHTSASFGRIDAIYTLGTEGPSRVQARPYRVATGQSQREVMHFLAPYSAVPAGDSHLVIIGPKGLSIRRIVTPAEALPFIERWFAKNAKSAPGLREHLLTEISERSPSGRALALEAQLRAPLQPKRAASSSTTPSAEIVSALSTRAGTLVTGWYRDPVDLLSGIDALVSSDSAWDMTSHLYRFPVEVAGPKKGTRVSATGFVTLAPALTGTTPILQPRFRLRLKSGAYHALVPHLQPADPVEARAAALRAVPPQHVDEALLAGVLAPVIAELHEQSRGRVGQPAVREIGTPVSRPKVSVIIPLYKALDFLRFQIAAFAADPWFRSQAELLYVLDSPEQAQEVEHLLSGLHLIYALPMRLVIMERNGGYARANNAGAALARGEALALVNSDVIPTSNGWLEKLVVRLGGRRRVGAVGPKLLFEDDSIQHAGMYFSKDHRGRWLNQHFHKGMPRDYPVACEERLVPAVTGACLVTTRTLFETVGGFTEDYVVGDYEDSDLCLKITMTDRKIAYAPDVELYHLERKSMSLNVEYMRGIAWQYNCALHAQRWGDLMTSIMQTSTRPRKSRNASI
jgi:GT2 family glycosyltransferase